MNKILRSYVTVLIVLIGFTKIFAQQKNYPKYSFETLKNNTTQRAVASISQDQQGFIWMGTHGLGLNKYNGLDYTSYQFSETDTTSISNSLIHTTYVDSQNRVWVGTEAGLDLYNREQDNFTAVNLLPDSPTNSISVQALVENQDGKMIVGTHQYGLFCVNPNTLHATPIKIIGVGEVKNLLINHISAFDNRIVLGTSNGLLELDEDQQIVKPLVFVTNKGKEQINTAIKTMHVDRKGSIWLGTLTNGLYKIDGNENGRYVIEHLSITSKRILSITETPRKTILCGTENEGMFEMSRSGAILNHYLNNKFNNNGFKSNSVWSVFVDDQDRIWIGYYNNGVGIFDKFYDKFADIESKPNYPNSLQSSSVTGIIKDASGRLWIGMDGGGVDVYDPTSNTFTHLLNTKNDIANGLDSPDVQTIFKDSKGNIWVGTWDYGIYLLKKGTSTFINYSVENTDGQMGTNRILSFSEDSKGIIWIGTFSRGIHSYNPTSDQFTNYDQDPFFSNNISYSDVRRVYVDSEDNIWIGGNAGLFKLKKYDYGFNIQDVTSRFYMNKGSHSNTSLVLDIYEDSTKNIWIGTDGAGLCRYDMKNDSFTWMDVTIGLDKVTVSSIIEDEEGFIWAAGNNGLTKINRKNKTLKNFTVNDGLLTNDFNNDAAFKDKNGHLYFGSYEGINYFDPQNLLVNTNAPAVYLSDLKIFNKPITPEDKNSPLKKDISQTQKITLSHDQSVFSIDYASIDFTRPEKIQFAYYLQGFEDEWNYVQNTRSATYTNLPAGKYTFKVKAANSDGIWNDEAATLKIEILRPWWFTNIAISLYAIAILFIAYFTFKFLDARIKTKRAIVQERERHLQEEALHDKKIQFFTNISHEFRTPLTLIMSPLEDVLNDSTLSKKINDKLKTIHKNTTRLKRLVDELMDFRKLQFNKIPLEVSSFNIKDLLSDILNHFKDEAQQRNIVLSLELQKEVTTIWADKNKLEKIIFNILSNAFKSTANNGIITVTVTLKDEHLLTLLDQDLPVEALEISIEDTGKGIHPDELTKIFDRFYQIKDLNEQYYSGTGIGLEVVKSFVELHRGDILVESEMGVGTKFKILIPIHKEHYNHTDLTISPLDTNTSLEQKEKPEINLTKELEKNKKTVLIIEDNFELRTYIKEELKNQYKIIEAEDGEEGLKKATKHVPDVVITDVIMPQMGGYEFCAKLKNDLSTSHIPVLMLTAKAMVEDWVEGLESGADVYLNKPFEMKVMQSYLKQLINNRELLFSKYMAGFKKDEVESNSSSLDQQFILNIIKYTQENIREANLNVEKLAAEFNLSRSQLYRKIKALTGLTANELIRKIRLERAKELIEKNGSNSISEISYNVGFSSPSYFSKCFKAYFGILPTEVNEENQ